ncbi:thioesterase II family protein, partial [Pseudonocardia pini]|uniref:thioesterase II family protein n=1 Tax=Pseudonocardia pini TaxID=2758030 RepID=UPI0015F07916
MSTAPLSARSAARGWLRTPRPVPEAAVRLVCLPHAGGAASAYRPWLAVAPADVELTLVQYPGRQDRIREEPWRDAVAMARAIVEELRGETRPLVLFGHSLGGTIAFEVARRLRRPPVRLVVSAQRGAPERQRTLQALVDSSHQ